MSRTGRPATGKTPHRTVRIGDPVWLPAQAIAAARGETMTAVIERALRRYINQHTPPAHDTRPDDTPS